jgi:hypothetical protein
MIYKLLINGMELPCNDLRELDELIERYTRKGYQVQVEYYNEPRKRYTHEVYEYMGDYYLSSEALDEAIENEVAPNYNNAVGLDEAIDREFNEVTIYNANSFETFKMYCKAYDLNPSHADTLMYYRKWVK